MTLSFNIEIIFSTYDIISFNIEIVFDGKIIEIMDTYQRKNYSGI